MASHYKCGQYNDVFSPKRLQNWCVNTHPWQQKCQEKVKQFRGPGHLDFIADDRGHILPHIKKQRNLKPDWGPRVLRIWDLSYEYGKPCWIKAKPPRETYPTIDELPHYFPRDKNGNYGGVLCDLEEMGLIKPKPKPVKPNPFDEIKMARPPVVWIYGHPPKSISRLRKSFGRQLAQYLGFTYINFEEMIPRWYKYTTDKIKSKSNRGISGQRLNLNMAEQDVRRQIMFASKLIDNPSDNLNESGVLEFIKMAMIEAWPTRGYVIEAFPVNEVEARAFEEKLWRSAAGVYFLSSSWTDDKSVEPPYIKPNIFRREEPYTEAKVEAVSEQYGYKTIKIHHADELDSDAIAHINGVIKCYIGLYPKTLLGEYEILAEQCLSMQEPPVFYESPESSEESSSETFESTETEPEPKPPSPPKPKPLPKAVKPKPEPKPPSPPKPVPEKPKPMEKPKPEEKPKPIPEIPDYESSSSEAYSESSEEIVDWEPGEFHKPYFINPSSPNRNLDADVRPMDFEKSKAGSRLIAFPDANLFPHNIPFMSKTKKHFREYNILAKHRSEDDPPFGPPLESSTDSEDHIEYSRKMSLTEIPPDNYHTVDPVHWTPYTFEPNVDDLSVHHTLPTRVKHRRVSSVELNAFGFKRTLKEKIENMFRPDETWMDIEDEQRRKEHVPLLCCFDKRLDAALYPRTAKAVEDYVEPPKKSFITKIKETYHEIVEALKPKESEEVLPAPIALAKWNAEHEGVSDEEAFPELFEKDHYARKRPVSPLATFHKRRIAQLRREAEKWKAAAELEEREDAARAAKIAKKY